MKEIFEIINESIKTLNGKDNLIVERLLMIEGRLDALEKERNSNEHPKSKC